MYVARPQPSKTVEANIPKYDLAARILCLNSSTKDRTLGIFLSSTETVVIDENLTCADPIMQAMSYSVILRLINVPSTYQAAHITKCHLPLNMTWPSSDRSHGGALSLKTLGEYYAGLHTDVLHSVTQLSCPVPQVDKMINLRLGFQNAVSTVQRCNDEIADCESIKDMTCVNRDPNKDEFEQHTIACYGFTTRKV